MLFIKSWCLFNLLYLKDHLNSSHEIYFKLSIMKIYQGYLGWALNYTCHLINYALSSCKIWFNFTKLSILFMKIEVHMVQIRHFHFWMLKKKSDQMCSSYFLPISTLQIAMHLLPCDHPYITSTKGLGGWVIQSGNFCWHSVLYLCWPSVLVGQKRSKIILT